MGSSLAGAYGSLTLNGDGSYTYVINEANATVQALRVTGQQITDAFTYTMQDSGGLADVAELIITIDGRNDAPAAADDTGTALEAGGVGNATAGSTATGNVLTNDTDADAVVNGETKTVTTTGSMPGLYGTLVLNASEYTAAQVLEAIAAARRGGGAVGE